MRMVTNRYGPFFLMIFQSSVLQLQRQRHTSDSIPTISFQEFAANKKGSFNQMLADGMVFNFNLSYTAHICCYQCCN